MPSERIRARKAAPTAPTTPILELPPAYEFLLAGVQALVALAVVLARKRLAAHTAHERPLIRVRAEVGAEVVGAREALRAEVALEGGRVFLAAAVGGRGGVARGVGGGARGSEFEDVIAVGDAGGGGAAGAL